MAHASCYNGHSMWNGDGKPVVWAFRVGFLRDYMALHPDFLLDTPQNGEPFGYDLSDCVSDDPNETLDCWYCDECGCLAVFYSHYRVDYAPIDPAGLSLGGMKDWESYIALREEEFEGFQDFSAGMSPLEAIGAFPFQRSYLVSPDGSCIVGYDREGRIVMALEKKRFIDFEESAQQST